MQCQHCDYLLFNLTQPVCPECGHAYHVADYRFEPGDVSFHCPHCDQSYYGNDPQGLPSPRHFQCVQCGSDLSLEDLRVVPRRDDARGTIAACVAWDQRRQIGWLRAWWDSFKMILGSPTEFFRRVRSRSVFDAWLFGVICCYIGLLPYAVMQMVLMLSLPRILAAGGAPPAGTFLPIIIVQIFMGLLMPLAAPILFGALHGGLAHLGILALAPKAKPFRETFIIAMYALGPYALAGIPICGGYVGGIWTIVSLILALSVVHETSGGRATIAVLWPLIAASLLAAIVVWIALYLP